MSRQHTIKRSVYAIGIGVHSGTKVRMTLRPAGENTGILFVRTDYRRPVAIRALAQNVSDTTLSTSIAENGVQVATVEHLLSGLWGLGIDNLVVELNGEEVPIMDGSALPFVELINSVGTAEQNAAREFIRIKRTIRVTQGDGEAMLKPYDGFRGSYTFVADHPVFNRHPKRIRLDFSRISYAEDLSRARSFGLVGELCKARAINKCLGSSLRNAVGIDDFSILNKEGLRYRDEFVKHKLLDAMGDLYLLGRPILGEFEGLKSGHELNNKLVRALLRCEDAWEIISGAADSGTAERQLAQPAILAWGTSDQP